MKYFLIAGEASGDLHAAHLMQALKQIDTAAQFRYFGGEKMQAVGGELLVHYRDLAYMGFVQVALHLPTILRGMKLCRQSIVQWQPDVVILIDYPGFNLKMAQFVKKHNICPVFYYISPKIWAWKEHRIHAIRQNVDRLFSILPFEVPFFEDKHHYPISYVGNPSVDEVSAYLSAHTAPIAQQPVLALLPGSRRQEITDNLSRMLNAVAPLSDYKVVVAQAPSMPREFYDRLIAESNVSAERVEVVNGRTYELLHHATAALVTSGTATLEAALFLVPQVVCYRMSGGRVVNLLRPYFLKVPYISLVNLIVNREVVPELVAADMTPDNVRRHLQQILPGAEGRERMLKGYDEMIALLGEPGAPQRAAREMVDRLRTE